MNEYSKDWFDTFLATVDPAQTQREVAFLQRQLPIDHFARVLDVCCGLGRHSGALAANGYRVTGVERDPALVSAASRIHPAVKFVCMDASEISHLAEPFDAVICMWQSFGFGDRTENDHLLEKISRSLRAGGRFVLDIYNRNFFEPRQGVLRSHRNSQAITETKSIDGDRIRIEIIYDDNDRTADRFDWEIFTVEQISARAAAHRLVRLTACSGFDERQGVSDALPRMQLVFEMSASAL
ncbi:hypothetical protein BH09PLA1_BH09PLA1_20220 [soil metagenome]